MPILFSLLLFRNNRSSGKDAVSDWGSGAREAFITHRYVIVEEGVSPSTAASRCAVNGGELATVTSNEEFDFLAERLQPGVTYWLGAQCQNCTRVDEDKWFWPNGEPLPLKVRLIFKFSGLCHYQYYHYH